MAFDSTYAVLTTDEANMITEYNKDRLLPRIEHDSLLRKLIDKDTGNFPPGKGTTMVLRRRLPLTLFSDDLATTLQFTDPTPQKFKAQTITANLRELQGAVEYSKLVNKVDFNECRDIKELVAQVAAESWDKALINIITLKLLHVRADWDGYQVKFVTTTGCTTTSIRGDAVTGWAQADHYWGGNSTVGYITDVGRSDPCFGETTIVTAFAATGDIATVAALENTPTDLGDTFVAAIGTGLSTDTVSLITLARMCAAYQDLLKGSVGYYKYANPMGMGYKLLVDPGTDYDLSQDSSVTGYRTYNDKSDGFKKYRVGQIYNHDVIAYSNLKRETVAGVADDDGDVFNVLSLGKHSSIISELGNLKFFINGGEKTDSGNRLGKQQWIDFSVIYACAVQNGCAGMSCLATPSTIF